jgi:Mrp family chromosome partitioning ATPase
MKEILMHTTDLGSLTVASGQPAAISQTRKGSTGYAAHYRGERLLKPTKRGSISSRLVCLVNPRAATAERYYSLRHAVEKLRPPTHGLVVAITSPGKGDGKTLTALNLAGALAQDPAASVLLIDLDIRQQASALAGLLDLKPQTSAGLIDWLTTPPERPDPPIGYLPDFNFYLLQSGGCAETPYELLNSAALGELMQQLRLRFDFVIIDAPQAIQLPDISLLARNVDGFLFVIRAGVTDSSMLEETLDQIQPEKVLGLVFNGDTAAR